MNIINFYPKNLLNGQSKQITILGNGFISPVIVIVNNVHIPCYFVSDNMTKFLLHSLDVGTYDIFVKNGDGSITTITQSINISNRNDGNVLGTSNNPIVLPLKQIGEKLSPNVNTVELNELYITTASVDVNLETGNITGSKPIVIPDSPDKNSITKNEVELNTIWGNFKN